MLKVMNTVLLHQQFPNKPLYQVSKDIFTYLSENIKKEIQGDFESTRLALSTLNYQGIPLQPNYHALINCKDPKERALTIERCYIFSFQDSKMVGTRLRDNYTEAMVDVVRNHRSHMDARHALTSLIEAKMITPVTLNMIIDSEHPLSTIDAYIQLIGETAAAPLINQPLPQATNLHQATHPCQLLQLPRSGNLTNRQYQRRRRFYHIKI